MASRATTDDERVRELEAALARSQAQLAAAVSHLETTKSKLESTEAKLRAVDEERNRLRRTYDRLLEEYEILKRRIFAAKAERVDTTQLMLEFAETRRELEKLAKSLEGDSAPPAPEPKPKSKPTGRRDLNTSALPEEVVEITDSDLEGKAERIGFETSFRLGYRPGGPIRILVRRVTYRIGAADAGFQTSTALLPAEVVRRGLLAPSMIARILVAKYSLGLPFYRLEEDFARQGASLDRGTMSRYADEVGACFGGIVSAAAEEAKRTAFCLSTDATGVAIQPTPLQEGKRQACRKGHFFVVLADRDHVFFEYREKHTSAAVCDMFRGYAGYVHADASAVYDSLFRGAAVDRGPPPTEVACWAHARRKFWEAATAHSTMGREGLLRIRALYELEAKWAKLPPIQRRDLRQAESRPLLDSFFAWAELQRSSTPERGLEHTALHYAVRHEQALRRFLEDGRLRLDNNASERALRPIAIGRKNWLFFGSDSHAESAANVFSLVASCKLHGLEPEAYFTEVIRLLPYWPKARFLELAPKYWAATRARLDGEALARELGPLEIPAAP